jgi:hypothetical protein
MTGLSRPAITVIGLALGIVAVVASEILVGAASLCGLDENQIATGYCSADHIVRALLVGLPVLTVIVGYAISLWTGRLTPVALAATGAVIEGLLGLVTGL